MTTNLLRTKPGKVIALFQHTITPNTKRKTMNAFLPQDYEAPSSSGNYMKLQPGENKIRILSPPVLGWEDWTLEKKPVRFPYNQKPAKPIDPERPVKHFWAMIVWNYREERVQILHVTQASIRSAIQSLCENEDWGAPYFYDIKITKNGEKKDTEYNVAPSPHKPVSEVIKKAFYAKPCDLDALFTNKDPFAPDHTKGFTPGVFEEMPHSSEGLSEEQQQELVTLCKGDDELQERILAGYKVNSLSEIHPKHFATIKTNLMNRKLVK